MEMAAQKRENDSVVAKLKNDELSEFNNYKKEIQKYKTFVEKEMELLQTIATGANNDRKDLLKKIHHIKAILRTPRLYHIYQNKLKNLSIQHSKKENIDKERCQSSRTNNDKDCDLEEKVIEMIQFGDANSKSIQ